MGTARLPRNFSRTVAGGIGAALLAAGVAVAAGMSTAAAQAGPSLAIEPATAEPAGRVVATGQGFDPSGTVPVLIYLGSVQAGREVATATPVRGRFTVAFAAPAREGHHPVIACRGVTAAGTCREQASARLTVVAPSTTTVPDPDPDPTTVPTVPDRLTTPTTSRTPTTGPRPGDLRNPTGTPTTGTTPPPPPGGDPAPDPEGTPGGSTTSPPSPDPADPGDPADPPNRQDGIEIDRPAAGPGERAAVSGWGCAPDVPVTVVLAGRTVGRTRSDGDGAFTARLDVPELDPGRYEVVARCPQALRTDLDVVLATSARPVTSTLGVLVFFVLSILGVARRLLGVDASDRGAA